MSSTNESWHPPSTISNILLTHMHIDHCVEFPSLVFGAYLTGKKDAFNVIDSTGTTHFVNSIFDDTYNFAKQIMNDLRKLDIDIHSNEYDAGVVYDHDGLIITCLPMKHGIETLAFRFDVQGKSIVFSSDTASCDNIISIAKDCDILVMECSFPESAGVKSGHS